MLALGIVRQALLHKSWCWSHILPPSSNHLGKTSPEVHGNQNQNNREPAWKWKKGEKIPAISQG